MLNSKRLTMSAVISAGYIVLSLITFPISGGAIQLRLSEALTLLPLLFPESIAGVFIGCALSNLITGCTIFDVLFGSLITLISAVLTYLVGRKIKKTPVKIFVGGIFPVLLNAFLLPVIWYFLGGEQEYVYILSVAFLIVSQSVSVYLFGSILYINLLKLKDRGNTV